MNNNYFKILRKGTHTTFQDNGFNNLQHFGIPAAGVVDKGLFYLGNNLLKNPIHSPVIEFALQGPSLKLINGICRFVITGKVLFNIITRNEIIKGSVNETYTISKNDIIDILSTINSNYAYLNIEGGFKLKKEFNSYSTLETSGIGLNKIIVNKKIYFNKNGSAIKNKITLSDEDKNNYIRVVSGPQMHYFFPKIIKKFFSNTFVISKNINRIGLHLEQNICKSVKSHDIPSEGIVKGSIQVPGDGNPIILLNDHPTIGGYPKIAIVIMADIHKVAQLPIGTSFKFKQVTLIEAEKIYNVYMKKINFISK